jgi:hypothetical protein
MRKLLFSFSIAVSSTSSAAILTTQAICDNVIVNGTSSASCGDLIVHNPFAMATAGPPTAPDAAFVQTVSADAAALFPHSAAASASVAADYLFTVTTGPTQGFFIACLRVQTDNGRATATFGGQKLSPFGGTRFSNVGTCPDFDPLVTVIPVTPESFTLGANMMLGLFLTASAPGIPISAQGFAGFKRGFQFFDASMNPISDVTYTLVEVPEPSTAALVICGLLILAVAKLHLRSFCTSCLTSPKKCVKSSPEGALC